MIILSVGMPRAGSGWYYNLTNDLMLAAGAEDARQIRKRYHLQNILTEVNCNIGALTARRLFSVIVPSLIGNTFVIKAHSAPTQVALAFIQKGEIKPTYIYRDPRDALLSVMENGRRAIERGHPNAFSPYVEFENALNFIEDYIHIGLRWMALEQVLLVRYEDLLLDYETEVVRLRDFLELDTDQELLSQIIHRYHPESSQSNTKGRHFSHGKIGRFQTKLSNEQQEQLKMRLGQYLIRLGYEN